MSIHYSAETFADTRVAKKTSPFQVTVERSFDLPPILHGLTVGLYLAFLGVMAFAFQDRGLMIPMAIFVIYIAMAFGVPALWVRMKPNHRHLPLSWTEFSHFGINTHTGGVGVAGSNPVVPTNKSMT
jgi:hypothetical protein